MGYGFLPINLSFFGGGGGGGGFPNTQGGNSGSSSNGNGRFFGKPGEVIKNGSTETKIGSDSRAIKERHNTDHGNPKYHTNPYDHNITWDKNGNPHFGGSINYPNGNVPDFE